MVRQCSFITVLAAVITAPYAERSRFLKFDVAQIMQIKTPSGSIDVPNVEPLRPHPDEMLGLALDTVRLMPINGLRYAPESGTCGWYIWGGETFSQRADFFSSIHVKQTSDYIAMVIPYLDLPPGFRFLIDQTGHKDVWFDASLLDV